MLGPLLLVVAASAADRDPLPAREIERPLVLPRGWTRLGFDLRLQPEGRVRRDTGSLAVAVGVLPRAELYVVAPVVRARTSELAVVGAGDPVIGARMSLWRAEPPNRSVALDLWFRAPHGAAPDGVPLGESVATAAASVVARAELSGLGLDGAVGGLLRGPAAGALVRGRAFVQAGPLVPGLALATELLQESTRAELELELELQVSRGLSLASAWAWPVASGQRALSLRVEASL